MNDEQTRKFYKDMEDPHKQAKYIAWVEQEEEKEKARKIDELLRQHEGDDSV
jgi:hypothetical protein